MQKTKFRASSFEIRAILVADPNYKTPDVLRICAYFCPNEVTVHRRYSRFKALLHIRVKNALLRHLYWLHGE